MVEPVGAYLARSPGGLGSIGTVTERRGGAARPSVPELLAALLRGDEDAAFEMVEWALLETRSRTAVFADLLHPAQTELGNLWYLGRASSADEGRVAAAVRRIVRRLWPTPATRLVPEGSHCVLAVPRDDPHDIGVTMLALALQDHGWTTELVAPARVLADAVEVVAARRPNLLCLSAGHLPAPAQVEQTISAVRAVRVPVLVGGVAFNRAPELWRSVGADGLGTDVRVGVVLARRLCSR
jgi:MerR family transcriptional regulator, light-induced transcriptional regulator